MFTGVRDLAYSFVISLWWFAIIGMTIVNLLQDGKHYPDVIAHIQVVLLLEILQLIRKRL